MPNVHRLVLGGYQVNCYIVHEEGNSRCCVVDPGYHPQIILEKLQELGLQLEAILLTHGHFDHVGAVKPIVQATGCRVFLHPAEEELPEALRAGDLYYTDPWEEGTEVTLAGMPFRAIHTPGHTEGSMCLITGDTMFTGDTLFAGTCGRSDLPCGNIWKLRKSLRRLAQMEQDYWILPGHGEATSLKAEQNHNPYLRSE